MTTAEVAGLTVVAVVTIVMLMAPLILMVWQEGRDDDDD